jgi:hypothetical protein
MMLAMPDPSRTSSSSWQSADRVQDSSTAKVLADYAAMPNSDKQTQAEAPATQTTPATGTGNKQPREIGGREGPEPTRFGDWEKAGRCIDF